VGLLTVAITRARDRLYVIGDRAAWQTAGFARYLGELPAPGFARYLGELPAPGVTNDEPGASTN